MNNMLNSRYYPLIQAIVKHANIASSGMADMISLGDGLCIPAQEWMVVEMVVELREEYRSMVELSRMLGSPPSTFFRMVTHLQKAGLVDKYHIRSNRKSIVLRPTELAIRIYEDHAAEFKSIIWKDFCRELEGVSDNDIVQFTQAIIKLNDQMPSARYTKELDLIKVE